MEISDRLRCLFSGRVESRGGSYAIEVPRRELDVGDVEEGQVYQVAILEPPGDAAGGSDREVPAPPVDEGEVREVEIVDIGEQGDGIAKVERGYVIIVPGADVGETVTIEITTVQENYALGEIVSDEGSQAP